MQDRQYFTLPNIMLPDNVLDESKTQDSVEKKIEEIKAEKTQTKEIITEYKNTPCSFPFDIYEAYRARIISFMNGAIYVLENDPRINHEEKIRRIAKIQELKLEKEKQLNTFKQKTQGYKVTFESELYQFYNKELPEISGLASKEIALGEAFYVWQKIERPARRTTYERNLGVKGKLIIEQIETPRSSPLTKEQKEEYLLIHLSDKKKRPAWFNKLDPFAQHSLLEIVPRTFEGSWKKCERCRPTVLRHIPGQANAAKHELIVTHVKPDGTRKLMSSTTAYRQGVPTSINMPSGDHQRSANQNLAQMLEDVGAETKDYFRNTWGVGCDIFMMQPTSSIRRLSDKTHLYLYKDESGQVYYRLPNEEKNIYLFDSPSDSLKEIPFDQLPENPKRFSSSKTICDQILEITSARSHTNKNYIKHFHMPILLNGLLTPARQAGIFSMSRFLDFFRLSGNDNNTKMTREKDVAAWHYWHEHQNPYVDMFSLNVALNKGRRGKIAPNEKFILFTKHFCNVLNRKSIEWSGEAKEEIEDRVPKFRAALSQLENYQAAPESLEKTTGQNPNLYLAALYDVTTRLMKGASTGNCKSSKDRKGTEYIMADAMLIYYAEQQVLLGDPSKAAFPKYGDTSDERRRFVDIFCELYVSGHQLLVAHDNAPGCPGIKDSGMLDRDIVEKLKSIYNAKAANPSPSPLPSPKLEVDKKAEGQEQKTQPKLKPSSSAPQKEIPNAYSQSKQIADFNKPGNILKKHKSKFKWASIGLWFTVIPPLIVVGLYWYDGKKDKNNTFTKQEGRIPTPNGLKPEAKLVREKSSNQIFIKEGIGSGTVYEANESRALPISIATSPRQSPSHTEQTVDVDKQPTTLQDTPPSRKLSNDSNNVCGA